jgi:hypothetical protein
MAYQLLMVGHPVSIRIQTSPLFFPRATHGDQVGACQMPLSPPLAGYLTSLVAGIGTTFLG